jgi:hypothetical protein
MAGLPMRAYEFSSERSPYSYLIIGRQRAVLFDAPTSVSLYDEQRRELLLGDFSIWSTLRLSPRGESQCLPRHHAAAARDDPSGHSDIHGHMADPPAPVRAPVLESADLRALEATLFGIEQGKLASTGFYPGCFPYGEL